MTPTAERLQARLDDRYRWFRTEWFFKWHYIGRDGPVTIDTFDGQSASYGGIRFSGTARQLYWDAVVRGVRKEITDQLAWVDAEVRNYNPATAIWAIDECAGQIISFVRRIRRDAVEKDRILRGNGTEFPSEHDAGRWEDTDAPDIQARANALKAALPFAVASPTSVRDRSLAFWNANQGWLQLLAIGSAIIIGIAGIVAALLG